MKRHSAKPSKLLQGLINNQKPTRALKYQAALNGDTSAVEWLHFDRPQFNDHLSLLLTLCRDNAPVDLLRRLTVDILVKHPDRLRPASAGSREVLAEILRNAALEVPSCFDEGVTVWRGTSGISVQTAAAGYFWALDRDKAMEYAIQAASIRGGAPLLIRAELQRHEISAMLFVNEATYKGRIDGPGFTNIWDGCASSAAVLTLTPPREVAVDDYKVWSAQLLANVQGLIDARKAQKMNWAKSLEIAGRSVRQRMRDVGYQP